MKSLEVAEANARRALLRLPLAKRLVTLSLGVACQAGLGEAIRVTIRPTKTLSQRPGGVLDEPGRPGA